MRLRDTTVVFLCAFLGVMVLIVPMPVFGGPYEGIREGEVEWTCSMPPLSLAPPDVDLDEVREAVADAHVTARTTGRPYIAPVSGHPLCGGLARTQVVLALLALAGAAWRGRVWWRTTADTRAEKRFKRLHQSAENPQGGNRIFR
ncbi:hypothetical protein [Candidatus Poriferisodalis sp.]|uniref:hypothetical protein n=1 Tax=Candidatus Poriferisodalis sp. TaxID=3101277 RepID=UPI003C6F36AA